MTEEEKSWVIEWAIDHHGMVLAVYHETLRLFTPVNQFRTKAGELRFSAYDSTHGDEETPRTYKPNEFHIMGMTRIRPRPVEIREAPHG